MPPSLIARTFAWTGAALFAASLVLFGIRYAGTFGQTADSTTDGIWISTPIDVALFTVFALHHTLCARLGVKAIITRVVPHALERAVYVWLASGLFVGVLLLWQPVPGVLWRVTGLWRGLAGALQAAGAVMTLASARTLDVFELAGVRRLDTPRRTEEPTVISDGLYAFVRHPIYFAWLLMVWPVAVMTGTRLVFASVSTLYLCLAIPFEERDLRRTFGPAYVAYASRVRWRLLPFIY